MSAASFVFKQLLKLGIYPSQIAYQDQIIMAAIGFVPGGHIDYYKKRIGKPLDVAFYEADGVTLATPPAWALDSETNLWKVGVYVLRNDNSGVPERAGKGQLYGSANGESFSWLVTWPYADDDIVIESIFSGFLNGITGYLSDALLQIDNINKAGQNLNTVTDSQIAEWNGKEDPLTFSNGVTRTDDDVKNDLITGKIGGQTVIGGTGASENLTLQSTSNITKGVLLLNDNTVRHLAPTAGTWAIMQIIGAAGSTGAGLDFYTNGAATTKLITLYNDFNNTIFGSAKGNMQINAQSGKAVIFNSGAIDVDFIIKKLTSGDAYLFDAGNDDHTFNSPVVQEAGVGNKYTQTTHGFIAGNAIYHTGTTWALAQANSANTLATHIVIKVQSANIFIAGIMGKAYLPSHGFTAGEFYYLSTTVAGGVSTSVPTALGEYSQPLFYVLDANHIVILPYRPTVANNRYMTNITNVSALTYTVDQYDELVKVDATGGNATITLPTISSLYDGFTVTIKKIDSSVNTVSIITPGAEQIDGADTLVISTQYTSYTLIYDSSRTEWSIT